VPVLANRHPSRTAITHRQTRKLSGQLVFYTHPVRRVKVLGNIYIPLLAIVKIRN
jgi:hypothetical protein